MKMQHELAAERDGVEDNFLVMSAHLAPTRELLVELKADEGTEEGDSMSDKATITSALTGVLTDPRQHPVPVTPEEMAREAKAAFNAGAAVMHVHFRQQAPWKGTFAVVGTAAWPPPSCRRSAMLARASF